MDALREKMRIKQDVGNPQKTHQVIIPTPSKPEVINLNRMTIIDDQGHFDIADLNKKLEEGNLKKVTLKNQLPKRDDAEAISEIQAPPKKKAKKITNKTLLMLEEEGVDIFPPGPCIFKIDCPRVAFGARVLKSLSVKATKSIKAD